MEDFERAHYYMKEMMETTVLNTLKFINSRDKNMKFVITGGDVLARYFDGPTIFLTHDYDIKLTVNKRVDLDEIDKEIIYDYQAENARIFEKNLNNFYIKNRFVIDNKLKKSYNVVIDRKNQGPFEVFKANDSLTNIVYTLISLNTNEKEEDTLIDLWIALPETLKHPYYTWLGEDPILSLDGSDYYIPTLEVNGVLITGLGYMLWDTQRMIEYSAELKRKGKPNKLQRYIDKQKAIYNDLNNPIKRLSCIPFKKFVKDCNEKEIICTIDGERFYNKEEVLEYAKNMGYLSKEHISEIKNGNYSLSYICRYIQKLRKL